MDVLKILELTPRCTKEDAKRSFRRLSFLYHPDKHPGDKNAEEAFKRINNAYEQIKKNPALLKGSLNTDDTFYMETEATIEDFYFEKKKTIHLKKIIPCPACSGYGTQNLEKGLCRLCKGSGQINNKILGMMDMKKNCACPSCSGLGFKKEYICSACKGKKTSEVQKDCTFIINSKDYQKKYVILIGEGNHYPSSEPGNVFIKLKIKPDPLFRIEDGNLCLDYLITPVQSFIGDSCEVDVFGKKIAFKVPLINGTTTIEDKRKDLKHPRKIIIRTLVTKPVLNKETRELYKEILKLEKALTKTL
jgi:molecular chaperone DnaJ